MDENTSAIAKNLSKAVADVTDIVHKLFGPLADEFGQMMGDKVYEYRVRNLVAVMNRVKRLLAANNVSPQSVPPRLLLPIAEAASVEADDTLQEKWAGLLATASLHPDMSPSFAEVLKQLSPFEAQILDSLFDEVAKTPKHLIEEPQRDAVGNILKAPGGAFNYFAAQLIKEPRLGTSMELAGRMPGGAVQAQLILRNLERLGLVSLSYEVPRRGNRVSHSTQGTEEVVIFTRFAMAFVEACRGPQSETSTAEDGNILQ